MKFLFSLVIIISSYAIFAKTWHSIGPGGNELILESFNFGKESRPSYNHPCIDCDLKATKLIKGKEIYSVIYHVDEMGFRTTKNSKIAGKKKHLLLIDGSVAFSEGLEDKHSLIELINNKSKVFHAYDIGFLGNGPQHNWVLFKSGQLKNYVKEKSGLAVLISHDQDIKRFVVSQDHLIYAGKFPNVIETSKGQFIQKGTIESDGSFLQKLLLKTCVPFLFCKSLLTKDIIPPTSDEVAKVARLFKNLEGMYREQFNVENFVIVWTGSDGVLETLKKHTDLKIVTIDYERMDSNHPSEKGASQIVDQLFNYKIIN